MINDRIVKLSSNQEMFESNLQPYQDALKKAGYADKLEYKRKEETKKKKQRTRSRNVFWFNPPFSQSIKTNIGATFLGLIDKHFRKSELKKYFNRSTIKVSYSCMPNIDTVIAGHNRKLLQKHEVNQQVQVSRECNCRQGESKCPLEGRCLSKSVIYKAEVKSDNKTSTYIGQTSNTFKERYTNHVSSFKNEKYKESTALSKYIWDLKQQEKEFEINWSKITNAPAYNPSSKKCQLCILEKTLILNSNHPNQLNKRTELMSKCRHRRKFLLSSLHRQENG